MNIRPTSWPRTKAFGFTLIELLVVIGIIAILASLLFPALSRAKQKAQGVGCLNNGKQMMVALQMYAGDNDDWLPPNPENGHTNAWVRGSMRKPREATNSAFLSDPQTAKLQPYIKKGVGVYKCPADKSTALIDGVKHPRVRTFSMNQAAGTEPTGPVTAVNGRWLDGTRTHRPNRPYRTYGRFSDMVKPSPAGLWMFIDEDETLINDGAFAVSMLLDPTAIIDWPGTYHNFSAGFAFADGHSEIHRWRDERTRIPAALLASNVDQYMQRKVQPGNKDLIWLIERTSAKAD